MDKNSQFLAVPLIYNTKGKSDIFKIEINDKEGIEKIAVPYKMTRSET